jgi:hypothetical protein
VLALLQCFREWFLLCLHIFFVVCKISATVDTQLVCCPLYLWESFSDGIAADSRNMYITCILDGGYVQRNIGVLVNNILKTEPCSFCNGRIDCVQYWGSE